MWFYVIKSISDALKIFHAFRVQFENIFNKKIKFPQYDGAKEFLFDAFQNELQDHEIFRRLFCSHIPQRNGSIERKNHHIIDMDLTLLHHALVPPKF